MKYRQTKLPALLLAAALALPGQIMAGTAWAEDVREITVSGNMANYWDDWGAYDDQGTVRVVLEGDTEGVDSNGAGWVPFTRASNFTLDGQEYSLFSKDRSSDIFILNKSATLCIENITIRSERRRDTVLMTLADFETAELQNVVFEGADTALRLSGGSIRFENVEFKDSKSADILMDGQWNGIGLRMPEMDFCSTNATILIEKAAIEELKRTEPEYADLTDEEIVEDICNSFITMDEISHIIVSWEDGGSFDGNGGDWTKLPDPTPTPDPDDNKPARRERDNGDYYGVEKWDEVKRQIAAADEGDTIKVSATGLPYFPSSVARELKGKDITLEIRKNGVTYTVNGLEIGAVEKIWYEFENIESQLLTAEAPVEDEAGETKPETEESKPNPSTGR
ncbi:MAG: hypothetical protein KH009_08275 [Clostridiales bacterium]|nr:hypothetical protein [Clostridiales bacterium]